MNALDTKMLRVAMLAVAGSAALAVASAAAAGDLNGVWQTVEKGGALKADGGKLPPLNAEGRKLYDEHVAARKGGKPAWDGTRQCQPPGIPRVYTMGMPFEIQQESKRLYFLYQWNRFFRSVDLDLTHAQQAQFAPYYFGWGTGAWDGKKLDIDGILFDDTTTLDDAGLPHSMDMHLTEQWTPSADGKSLTARFTIDDSTYYTAPWSTTLHFKRAPAGTEIHEDVCLERLGIVKVK